MSSPNERPGFFSTCTMKGESAMVALLSYALRREQRALSWCRVSGEGTNVVRYRTIIRMTRGFLGIRQIPALMAAVSVRSERATAKVGSVQRLGVCGGGDMTGRRFQAANDPHPPAAIAACPPISRQSLCQVAFGTARHPGSKPVLCLP